MNRITLNSISNKKNILSLVLMCAVFFFAVTQVYGVVDVKSPPSLSPWEEWVMYDNEKYSCPSLYNNFHEFRCIWPELLNLDFSPTGGTFKQLVTVLAKSWFYLPGDKINWPLSVTIDGENVAVLSHNNRPAIEIAEGKHSVAGKFKWTKIPQAFSITKTTGLVALRINNKVIKEPFIDKTGKLWIQKKTEPRSGVSEKDINIISARIFRLIEDTIPLQVHTLIRLSVSGERRRERLTSCLPFNTSTISVKTTLPVKLAEDGDLWVDVRPGQWDINLLSIINTSDYTFQPAPAPYGEELWAFKPYPNLRIARVEGVLPVDPTQSNMPATWKHFTTYLINKGDSVVLKEIQRGSSEKVSNALNLKRELWLDFDGKGATVKDSITGLIGQRSFFSMGRNEYDLGRISISGEDKLVTLYENETGIELERGNTHLIAISRMEKLKSGSEFSLGWKSKFKSAEGLLHLPPGWRILGIKGGSAAHKSTWIDSWSMLDFFLILVVSFAVARLFKWWWGVLFFIGLVMIAHEPGAPFYIWLVLIVTTGLYKIVEDSALIDNRNIRFKIVSYVHYFTIMVLCIISFVFISIQVKNLIYPQLESVRGSRNYQRNAELDSVRPVMEMSQKKIMAESLEETLTDDEAGREIFSRAGISKPSINKNQYQLPQQTIATQTGPGIPAWNWKTIAIDFGPVPESHAIALWLTTPFQNSMFSVVRVLFIVLMLFRLTKIKFPKYLKKSGSAARAAATSVLCVFTLLVFIPGVNAEIPPPEVLLELEKRLTNPPECFPSCAAISDAKIVLPDVDSTKNKKQFIEIILTVNAAVKTAIPLPAGSGTWQLYDLSIDNKPHLAVLSEGNSLWTYVSEGVHTVKLRGIAYEQKQFRFSFPLKPSYIETVSKGWNISGINDNNQADNVVQARIAGRFDKRVIADEPVRNSENTLSEFLRVKRTLVLGIEWNITTTVERFVKSQDQRNIIAEIPLLKDELIRTDNSSLSVEKGVATVSLATDINKIEWNSSLPITSTIELSIAKGSKWAEIWELRQSSMWHSSFSGIPVIYPEYTSGSFWYPWPGERLSLHVAKLESAPGESLTIDSVKADYYIGKGYNRIVLNTKIRTTSGRTHVITSPQNTIVERISLNGVPFPLSGNTEKISLPLQPGSQTIEIEWNESEKWKFSWFKDFFIPKKISFPEINIGQKLNNIDVYIHLPDKLWLLWTNGPQLGPAVLAWSMIGVVLIAAIILGRVRISPLTTIQWLILGCGLVSLTVPEMIIVVCWFMIMEIRKERSPLSPVLFNFVQVALIVWTLFVVFAFLKAISNGLIGVPDMQVAGNFSSADKLHWTLDHSMGILPRPWVLIYSLYIYQILMLTWALWLAFNILHWARLGISAMKSDGFWREMRVSKKRGKL